VRIRWNAELKAYEVQLPGYPAGKIVQTSFGPFGASGDVVVADGSKISSAFARIPYSYTGMIELSNATGLTPQYLAYGVATPTGSVPVTGSATYGATLDGIATAVSGSYSIYGNASLQFDFGAGKLSGAMDPQLNGPFDTPTVPRYTFTQTVFSSGSTTFSGSFDIRGPTPSSFRGQFTGPSAQELMASFTAPFQDFDKSWGVMNGVMIGKRP
jgi:hypothetical protein